MELLNETSLVALCEEGGNLAGDAIETSTPAFFFRIAPNEEGGGARATLSKRFEYPIVDDLHPVDVRRLPDGAWPRFDHPSGHERHPHVAAFLFGSFLIPEAFSFGSFLIWKLPHLEASSCGSHHVAASSH